MAPITKFVIPFVNLSQMQQSSLFKSFNFLDGMIIKLHYVNGKPFSKCSWITVSNIIAEETGAGRGRFVPKKKTLCPWLHRTKGHL